MDLSIEVTAAPIIIAQVFKHIKTSSVYQPPGDVDPLVLLQIRLGLGHPHLTGEQRLFGLKGSGVMLVVIEKVNGNTLFAKKIVQSAIGIYTAENIKGFDAFHREVFGYRGGSPNRLALQSTGCCLCG